MGGICSQLTCIKDEQNWDDIKIYSFEYEDKFLEHGNTKLVEESLHILPEQIAKKVLESR